MMLNATFNNISVISWQSVSLAEETGVHGENSAQNSVCFSKQSKNKVRKITN
jgi:hypothetical protein